jgi:hypothetical protein
MMSWWALTKEAAASWVKHKDAQLGAALAYYSIFSLGPLMVIAIAIAGLVFGQEAVRGGNRNFAAEIFFDQGQSEIDPRGDPARRVDIPVTVEEEAGINIDRGVFRREDI